MKRVTILVYQVNEGLEYKGKIEFNRVEFNFKLVLGTNLGDFHKEKDPDDETKKRFHHRNLFQFELKNKDNQVEIEDHLFGFLVALIGPSVVDYYHNPEIFRLRNNLAKKMRGDRTKTKIEYRYSYTVPLQKIPKVLLK
ncbi:MAG: hypothetical protein JJE53_02235 [Candidatus Pacebacteria bacterium]|nr:hypothetical protein [Candidatus Paceibacterota bacterium]